MENVKVSVILPVYNGEAFLEACLNNVLSQSLREMEVICIDDGSTDGSMSILQAFAAREDRVRILRQNHQGAGAARNLGLQAAQGEFIAFLDCDDSYPNSETLQGMYQQAIATGCQITGGYHESIKGGEPIPAINDPIYERARQMEAPGILRYRDIQCDWYFQSFLFRGEFLRRNALVFPDYLQGEDPLFFVRTMIAAEEFCLMPEVTYCYREHETPVQWTPPMANDFLKSYTELLNIAAELHLDTLRASIISRLETLHRPMLLSMISPDNPRLPCLVCLADQRAYPRAAGEGACQEKHLKLTNAVAKKLAAIWDWRMGSAGLQPGTELTGVLTHQMQTLETAWQGLGQTDPAPIRRLIGMTLAALFSHDTLYVSRQTLHGLIQSGKAAPYMEQLSGRPLEMLQTVAPAFAFYEKFLRSHDDLNCRVIHQGTQPEQPDVTVVIPVYNAQAYLPDCLDSVVDQENIEIICVDDGSTDGCPAILDDYARRYPNITVLRQDNGGTAAARNAAIQIARGRYIQYLDSDDAMRENCYGDLVARMDRDGLDMLYFNGESFYESEELKARFPYYLTAYTRIHTDSPVMSGLESYFYCQTKGCFSVQSCMYLQRREYIRREKLLFLAGILHEDVLYYPLAMLKASRVCHISQPLYRRRVREGSTVTMQMNFRHVFGLYHTARELERLAQSHSAAPEIIDQILQTYVLTIYQQINAKMKAISDPSQREYYLALPDAAHFYTTVYSVWQQKEKTEKAEKAKEAMKAKMAKKPKAKSRAPKVPARKKKSFLKTVKKRLKRVFRRLYSLVKK